MTVRVAGRAWLAGGLLCAVALPACEPPGGGPGSIVIGGEGDPAATAGASPGASGGGVAGGGQAGDPLPDPTEPPLGPAPGASPRPGASFAPASPRPTVRPSPLPTVAPAPFQALPPAAAPTTDPQGQPLYPLPAGTTGLLTLSQPGFVPLTYEVGGSLPSGLSLSTAQPVVESGGLWTLSGQVSPPQAGVVVTLSRPGSGALALGLTNAQGAFSAQVRAEGRPEGIVVARTQDNAPRVALARVQLGPEGGTRSGLNLALQAPASAYRLAQEGKVPEDGIFPTLPFGLDFAGGMVVAAEGGDRPWRADLFSLPPGMLVTYRIGTFSLGRLERARNPEGTQWSEVGGSLESGFPPFLEPPLLEAVARPAPGARVAWPPVVGAAAYKLWLRADDGSNRLLWEAAVRQAAAPVPADAPAFEGPLVLEVEAIQATGANVMQLAGWAPRGLRLGDGLPGFSGRRSWAIKRFL